MENENENNIKTDETQYRVIENDIIIVTELIAKLDKKDNTVSQLRFILDDGRVLTHKPSYKVNIDAVDEFTGIKTTVPETRKYSVKDLPDKVYKINKLIIKSDKKLRMICTYTNMTTIDTRTGEEVIYPFMNKEQFDYMFYPVDKNNKQIKLD